MSTELFVVNCCDCAVGSVKLVVAFSYNDKSSLTFLHKTPSADRTDSKLCLLVVVAAVTVRSVVTKPLR